MGDLLIAMALGAAPGVVLIIAVIVAAKVGALGDFANVAIRIGAGLGAVVALSGTFVSAYHHWPELDSSFESALVDSTVTASEAVAHSPTGHSDANQRLCRSRVDTGASLADREVCYCYGAGLDAGGQVDSTYAFDPNVPHLMFFGSEDAHEAAQLAILACIRPRLELWLEHICLAESRVEPGDGVARAAVDTHCRCIGRLGRDNQAILESFALKTPESDLDQALRNFDAREGFRCMGEGHAEAARRGAAVTLRPTR